MTRPLLEIADLIHTAGGAFIERNQRWIRWRHVKVLLAIARCRTAALGGHIDECTRCGHRATISYNSCRNRHCPKCQTAARDRWIAARQKELLPTRYVHVVFTLPAQLARLALQNKKLIYGLLLRASAETLLEVAQFTDGQVTFHWRDSAHDNEQKLMTLSLDEFLRRFLLHILPKGFVRIRHFSSRLPVLSSASFLPSFIQSP